MMRKATKSWHGRTFGQLISKEKIQRTKKPTSSKKSKKVRIYDTGWLLHPETKTWYPESYKVNLPFKVFFADHQTQRFTISSRETLETYIKCKALGSWSDHDVRDLTEELRQVQEIITKEYCDWEIT